MRQFVITEPATKKVVHTCKTEDQVVDWIVSQNVLYNPYDIYFHYSNDEVKLYEKARV